ncbi:MAG: hypothetical protein RL660_2130 [Bacteroidota bacterium]|jgi:biotin carboxyl carrier protein
MYNIKVNSDFQVELNADALPSTITRLTKLTDTSYEALFVDGKTAIAHISSVDESTNTVTVKIAHNTYTAAIETPADQLVKKLGITLAQAKKALSLKSPMPGLILKVLVQAGDKVKKGNNLIILEAMKMENVFKASGEATVKEICVQAGQAVEKAQDLIIFE